MIPDLRPLRLGLTLSLLSIFLGFAMGGFFGLREDAMKDSLKASAEAVRETIYKGDDAAIQKTLDKSWAYMKRSHLHLGSIGTAALIQCLLLAFLNVPLRLKQAASVMLGLGAVGYGSFWYFAAQAAPGLGSTGAAKESLKWLGQSTSGLCLLGTALALYCLFSGLWRQARKI